LQSLVERAIVHPQALQEEIFWSAQTKKKQFRVNLLNLTPVCGFCSPWWPDRINYALPAAFAIVVALLFVGPQRR